MRLGGREAETARDRTKQNRKAGYAARRGARGGEELGGVALMNVEEYFRELHQAGSDSLSASLADAEVRDGLSRCMQECLDWHAWKEVQSSLGRDPQVLEWATKELQFGAYLASIGHYRNAFAQIRLFLELGVSSIEFSANEIFRRKWMSGNRNMKWSTLIDEKAGIYAQEFCLVFFKMYSKFQIGRKQPLKR